MTVLLTEWWSCALPLQHDILPKLPHARCNKARPRVVYWRYEDRIEVQLFPKDTMQILGGNHDDGVCKTIRDFLMAHPSIHLTFLVWEAAQYRDSWSHAYPSRPLILRINVLVMIKIFPGFIIHQPVSQRHFMFVYSLIAHWLLQKSDVCIELVLSFPAIESVHCPFSICSRNKGKSHVITWNVYFY